MILDTQEKLITQAKMANNKMFLLTIQHDMPKCLSAIIKDKDWLWHLRFAKEVDLRATKVP